LARHRVRAALAAGGSGHLADDDLDPVVDFAAYAAATRPIAPAASPASESAVGED